MRYPAVKTQDGSTEAIRDLIPSKLAEAVWNCIQNYKSIPNFPQTETCELLILNRSVDQVKYTFLWHDFLFLSHLRMFLLNVVHFAFLDCSCDT